jgi:hypothetical protein
VVERIVRGSLGREGRLQVQGKKAKNPKREGRRLLLK